MSTVPGSSHVRHLRLRRCLRAGALFTLLSPVGLPGLPGLHAQGAFERTYGGDASEQGRSVVVTADGGYLVAGSTGSFGAGGLDVWLVRTDAAGPSLWTGPHAPAPPDEPFSFAHPADGGFRVA